MSQAGFTPISLYYSTTAAAAPSAGNLVAGELALNTLDEKLYFKNSAGTVKLLASNAGASGSVTSVAATVPSFLSIAGSPITTSGTLAITLSGTALPTTSGGTGLTSFTANGVVYASSSSALATGSSLTFDGTTATTPRLALGGTTLPSAGTATLFSRTSDNNTYLQTGSGNNVLLLDGSQNTMYNAAPTFHDFLISSSAAMRLTSTGLGIGTSSPSVKLHVTNSAGELARFNGNTAGTQYVLVTNNNGTGEGLKLAYTSTDGSAYLGSIYNAYLGFITNNTERARFSATGGFSVGTTADPGAGAIYATGNITAFYSSDIKFKENVRDIPDALATVNAIGGKLFDWTDEYIEDHGGADGYFVQKADFGVVAQDVQKVFPIAVRTRQDGSLAVDYEKLGALAFAALVELTKRVEALEVK